MDTTAPYITLSRFRVPIFIISVVFCAFPLRGGEGWTRMTWAYGASLFQSFIRDREASGRKDSDSGPEWSENIGSEREEPTTRTTLLHPQLLSSCRFIDFLSLSLNLRHFLSFSQLLPIPPPRPIRGRPHTMCTTRQNHPIPPDQTSRIVGACSPGGQETSRRCIIHCTLYFFHDRSAPISTTRWPSLPQEESNALTCHVDTTPGPAPPLPEDFLLNPA